MSNRNFTIHNGERTSSLNGFAIKATSETIALAFDVTIISGAAATLDIEVEWSPNGTNFGSATSPDVLPQITTAGVYQKRFDVKAKYYRTVFTIGGDIQEIQAVEHDHTGGTFTLSFDGQGPTGAIDWDGPVLSVGSEGLLTMDVKPSAAVAAEGLLTIDVKPIDGDTCTIDSEVYTYEDVLTNVAGNVWIGATLGSAQANLKAAINRELGYGALYADATDIHPTVSIAAFAADDAVLTAKTAGVASEAIVTTETFFAGTNIFDETTLGGVTTGIDGDTVLLGTTTYTFVDVDSQTSGEVFIGATLTTAQDALVVAAGSNDEATLLGFAANDSVVVANVTGADGNAIVSTETFQAGTNVFDATTLGDQTLGVNGVKTELELFSNITSVAVVRNGDGDWDVTFPSADGDVALMTIDDGNLTGGASATVTESTGGVDATATFLGVATHFDSNK